MRLQISVGALALGLVASFTGTALAAPGDPNRPSVQWANSWKEAVEEASARNVPIFVSFHQDG
jgi:hypothetical protein